MLSKGRPKKLSTPKQKKIIELFHNLFSSGFHLAEIVDFLRRSALLEEVYVTEMRAGLSAGQSFSEIVSRLGFSDSVVTQLSLSELHGNLTLSLGKIEAYLENLSKVKKKLIEVGTYPLMLLGFLVLIMLGLRNYLLPQLDSQEQPCLGRLGFSGCLLLSKVIQDSFFQQTSSSALFWTFGTGLLDRLLCS